ncbi:MULTISPECIES: hypothetical protein [Candidatus Ichthyocystis]|uniref:hypothetical protein n=1 Tax=Candidatus Ichthyocystis TaxID=2929841 RepID=UPI000B205AF5|nr:MULTISPECIES: hypothetical protein [Ichthyocystis]
MQLVKDPIWVPASNGIAAGPSSSAPVGVVVNVPLVDVAAMEDDLGNTALMNRVLPP